MLGLLANAETLAEVVNDLLQHRLQLLDPIPQCGLEFSARLKFALNRLKVVNHRKGTAQPVTRIASMVPVAIMNSM